MKATSTRLTASSSERLLAAWDRTLATDHHCHPLRPWDPHLEARELRACFTEAVDERILRDHVPNTAAYRLALRRLASVFGCEASEEAVLQAHSHFDPADLLDRSLTGLMLVDNGFGGPDRHPVRIPQREVLRLETLAEGLVAHCPRVGEWLEAVRMALRRTDAVAVKTIAAYRSSLRLHVPDPYEVESAYAEIRRSPWPRLTGDPLCHALLLAAAEECGARQLPLQVHCGLGDPDEDLSEASPLGLRPLFKEARFGDLKVAMLHCYPFHREAAYLCSVYPNAYMDLSLAIPLAAADGARALGETLGLCPFTKLLYATDASRLAEIYVVAASLHREALASALSEFLSFEEAEAAGREVLSGNAQRLYCL